MNDNITSNQLNSVASQIPQETKSIRELPEKERTPSWIRSVFANENSDFIEVARKHMDYYPPAKDDEGSIRIYWGRDNNYYYYKTQKENWTIIGKDKQYTSNNDITNELKFDDINKSSVRSYHGDYHK